MEGLMLVGEIEVLQDQEIRQRLWQPEDERYYPLGGTDPDYSVLHFTARWGNWHYIGLAAIALIVEVLMLIARRKSSQG